MEILLGLILLVVLSVSVLLEKVRRKTPLNELRRMARGKGGAQAAAIYKMCSYGESLRLFLWLTGSLAAAGLFILATNVGWWLVFMLSLAVGWLIWQDYTKSKIDSWQWTVAALIARPVAAALSILNPLLFRLSGPLQQRRIFGSHTKVYEKEDLLELLKRQKGQVDNRISETELRAARGALSFADKTVGSAMTPRRVVKMVAAGDSIGPHLMDELHASGFSRFPVVKDSLKAAHPDVTGILYLRDLVGYEGKGKVGDIMKRKVSFINEAQSLKDALAAFLSTEHHLLIVVNNFEEIVGVLSLEDVLEQILGQKIIDEFDRYDDMRAVAGLEAQKEQDKHSTAKVVE